VEKYGGVYSPISYEIFNKEGKTAFTIDPVVKKTGNSSMVEYDVCICVCLTVWWWNERKPPETNIFCLAI